MTITPGELAVMAKAFLTNREEVISALLKDIDTCQAQMDGCEKVLERWAEVQENPANLEKQLQTSVKCVRRLSDVNRRLLMLLMVYVVGNQFHSDSAALMAKLGRGEEALKELFKQKLKGGM